MSVREQGFHSPEPKTGKSRRSEGALTGYRRLQLELGELIRSAMNLASERRHERANHGVQELRGRELLARLMDDRFQLAVVGQFSRGKSTLMNAIMGASYLPTGALPMTSVVTTVRYGSRPRVTVRRRGGGRLPIETTLEELVRFVAQSSGEREELQVASAEVQLPAEILRLGFYFIDTPGIGSAVAANTATTKSFLPDADAVIFVTSFDAPLSEAELEFLADVRLHVDKVFFVVNKLDLVGSREAETIQDFIRGRLTEHADDVEPRLFAVSARDALAAKTGGGAEQLVGSGLPELERSLVRFLSEDKARTFLLAVAVHAQRLLAQLHFDLELGRAGGEAGVGRGSAAAFETRVEELFGQQRRVVDRLVKRIAADLPQVLAKRSADWTEQLRRLVLARLRALSPESDQSARDWAHETASKLEDALPGLLRPWIAARIAQTRSLLIEMAAADLATLHSLEHSIEQLAAASFRVPLSQAASDPGWSPSDLPEIAIEDVSLSIPLQLPRWSGRIGSGRQAEARLVEAIDAGIAAFVEGLRWSLVRAAGGWAATVAAGIERETRDSVDHVQSNVRNPVSPQQLAELEGLERRLTALRAEVAAWRTANHDAWEATPASAEPAPPTDRIARCVICEQIAAIPFNYMARAQWELFRHEGRRDSHARHGGFCPLHTWQYAEVASDTGIAVAYAPLAQEAAELIIAATNDPDDLASSLAKLSPGAERCPACGALAEAEREAVSEVVKALPARPADQDAPSLCVRHLAAVIGARPGSERVRWLARRLSGTLSRASEDMRTYSLKRESLRRHLLSDEEQAACLAVISHLAGRRELVLPWRPNDEIG